MKRLLFSAVLIVAIGSIGGNILTAHAQTTGTQTLTPEQTAALQQQLDVAKATLANLEMQAGVTGSAESATVTPQPTTATAPEAPSTGSGLSATEISAFKATLNTLAATLTQLNGSIAASATLTPSQEAAVQTTLNGMQSTLVAMANTIANAGMAPVAAAPSAGTPVAVNNPSAVTAPNTVTAQVAAPTTVQPAPNADTETQTAEASSFWSFTKAHWPTIVIVLLVIAILAILFWPEKESVRTVPTGTSGSGKPKSAPTAAVTMSQQAGSNQPRPSMGSNSGTPSPATPVANAVAAPTQK